MNTKISASFQPIIGVGNDPLPENTFKSVISKPITFITEKIASLIFWVKNHGDQDFYRNMKDALDGDKVFEDLKTGRKPHQDKEIKKASTVFLDTAWNLKDPNDTENTSVIREVTNKMNVSQARVLTDLVSWPLRDSGDQQYTNIQRGYPTPKPGEFDLSVEDANKYIDIFKRKHADMQKAFINYRHEVVNHQKSISRAWKGASSDPILLNARKVLMEQFQGLLNENIKVPKELTNTNQPK